MTQEQFDDLEAARLRMMSESLSFAMTASAFLDGEIYLETLHKVLSRRIIDFNIAYAQYNEQLNIGIAQWKSENAK